MGDCQISISFFDLVPDRVRSDELGDTALFQTAKWPEMEFGLVENACHVNWMRVRIWHEKQAERRSSDDSRCRPKKNRQHDDGTTPDRRPKERSRQSPARSRAKICDRFECQVGSDGNNDCLRL